MTYCQVCGSEIKSGAKFCGKCGTPIPAGDQTQTDARPAASASAQPAAGAPAQPASSAQPTTSTQPAPAPAAPPAHAAASTTQPASSQPVGAPATAQPTSAAPSQPGQPEHTSQPAQSASAPAPAIAASNADAAASQLKDKATALLSTNKGKSIAIGAAAAVVIILALVIFFVVSSSNVPLETLKQDVQQSIAQDGIASNNYVEKSAYTVTDLKITKQEQKKLNDFGSDFLGVDDVYGVQFSGTIKNEYFETKFTGTAYYAKQNGKWVTILSPSADDSTTTPLKGVSKISNSTSKSNSSDYEVETTNFNSTLDNNGGSYTSTASQDTVYKYWFATDTCTTTQNFVFTGKEWKTSGDKTTSDQKTEWNLTGKEFTHEPSTSGRTWTSVLTFTDASNPDSVKASYTMKWDADANSKRYVAGDYSGNLTGKLTHEFGKNSFKYELNDSANNVTYTGNNGGKTTSAGQGSVNTLKSSITTKYIQYEGSLTTSYFETSNSEFVQTK